jgi:hypothetical protein
MTRVGQYNFKSNKFRARSGRIPQLLQNLRAIFVRPVVQHVLYEKDRGARLWLRSKEIVRYAFALDDGSIILHNVTLELNSTRRQRIRQLLLPNL